MRPTDIQRIQGGDGSEFNTAIATLERMHREFVEANWFSGFPTIDGIKGWLGALRAVERELFPYMQEDERDRLDKVRVRRIREDNRMLNFYSDKLDMYERELRIIHAGKGFGLAAKQYDPARALEDDTV